VLVTLSSVRNELLVIISIDFRLFLKLLDHSTTTKSLNLKYVLQISSEETIAFKRGAIQKTASSHWTGLSV